MLTAQDMSYDEARNLHSKWLKHQAFMAELASNKEWLDKIEKVGSVVRSALSPTLILHCGRGKEEGINLRGAGEEEVNSFI